MDPGAGSVRLHTPDAEVDKRERTSCESQGDHATLEAWLFNVRSRDLSR